MTSYFEQRMAEVKTSQSRAKRRVEPSRKKYIQTETTRHGKRVYYFRKDGRRIRLPDPDAAGHAAFNLAYDAASRGEAIPVVSTQRPLPMFSLEMGRPGFVYFLAMGDKVKIGFSTNVGKRLKAIQTACPLPAEIVKIIPGSEQTERYFHAHFAANRINGEWFAMDGHLSTFLSYPYSPGARSDRR
ncbi:MULTISPECIES: GIY-YIG nuclease family protein [unclassified Mesorhizobium]|uniref:GIY-YIG nuclease family protein n=1 Tax=unclassified Mesorhizobium TaxID=325217 RepID=UPI001127A2CC|nr:MULTISPECIES: GIY-YIG nuclease family protein [unclassified Mesorhizobium]TPJ70445.1 GIY-YIG nuclease family protein [Mesorhizobium sp. B2-6-7]TPJ76900.1 GIY-YIG nuclease family protein [Mesorhizobium sp. B2-6-3]